MSLRCEVANSCTKDGEWVCTCENQIFICKDHQEAHYSMCKRPTYPIKLALQGQFQKKSGLNTALKELKEKVLRETEVTMTAVQDRSNSIVKLIDNKLEILREVGYGKNWDNEIIESISNFDIFQTSFDKFLKDASNWRKIEKVLTTTEVSNPAVEPTREEKESYLKSLGIKLPSFVKEIKFSRDGIYGFVCN